MSKIIRTLFAGSLIFMFSFMFAGQAHAIQWDRCISFDKLGATNPGSTVKFVVAAANDPTCQTTISLCSYRVYYAQGDSRFIKTQTLFDHATVTLKPGDKKTLIVDTDTCMNQIDLVEKACPDFTVDKSPHFYWGAVSGGSLCSIKKCVNDCIGGEKICGGNGYKTCSKGTDGCYHWSTVTDCATDEVCNDGVCKVNCTDECTTDGQRECSGNGFRTCGNYDSDRCREWNTVTDCTGDEICQNGSCIDKCYDGSCYNKPTINLTSTGTGKCGQGFRLKWTSTDATSCAAIEDYWKGTKGVSGSENIADFSGTRTFTIKCWGKGGTATDSITLNGDKDDYNLDVDAGDDVTVDEGETVKLRGSVDGDYDDLEWECTGGDLDNEDTLRPTFKAPSKHYDYDKVYTCTLTASNECGEDSDTMKVRVNAQEDKDIDVNLTVEPDSGCAPLNDVDLTVEVESDSDINEDYNYYFDCENDGDWDKQIITSKDSYTAKNLCDYKKPGTYTAKVKVVVFGKAVSDTATIDVEDCSAKTNGQVSINKTVRSIGSGSAYTQMLRTNPGDIVSYRIEITADNGDVDNVYVSDILPPGINNRRNVRLDGANLDGQLNSGVNIGSISDGQTKTITYDATVANAASFNYGENQMTNTATVTVNGSSARSQATVLVQKSAIAGATTVSTGFAGGSPLAIIAGLIAAIAAGFVTLRGNLKALFTTLVAKIKGNSEVKLAKQVDYVKKNNLIS